MEEKIHTSGLPIPVPNALPHFSDVRVVELEPAAPPPEPVKEEQPAKE